ncbi:hypothetical protein ACWKWU_07685 [Chitinophaga lutea]
MGTIKQVLIAATLFAAAESATAQPAAPKRIILTEVPKAVPIGKRWVLKKGTTARVIFKPETLQSGNACNAAAASHRAAGTLISGPLPNLVEYAVGISDLERSGGGPLAYTLSLGSFTVMSRGGGMVEKDALEFKHGQTVATFSCLDEMEIFEYPEKKLTRAEIGWGIIQLMTVLTPADLKALYGADMKTIRLMDNEGNDAGPGYVLFPNSINRLEVSFKEGGVGMAYVSQYLNPDFARAHPNVKSQWMFPGGIRLGDPMERLETVNSKPFRFQAPGSDVGGTVMSWNDGFLERSRLFVVLGASPATPNGADMELDMNDEGEVSSGGAKVKAAKLIVEAIGMNGVE